jgi:hypothetical protein
MKKLASFFITTIVILSMNGTVHANTYDSGIINLNDLSGSTFFSGSYSIDFFIPTPTTLSTPSDTVTSATLQITSGYVDGSGNLVTLADSSQAVPADLSQHANWNSPSDQTQSFNVINAFQTWPNGDGASLEVTVSNTNGWFQDKSVRLDSAELVLNYSDPPPPANPTPEPGTLILFGAAITAFGSLKLRGKVVGAA